MHNHHHQRRVAHLIGIGITSLCAVVLLASGVIGVPTPASAASSCGGVDTSIISGDACDGASLTSTDSADNPVVSVLIFVMKILTGAVGVAAVGTLIYAGILYSAAGGESGQVQKAKTIIKDTVIGIVCYAGMIIILNFVIPGGVFGQQSVTGGGTAASPGGNGGDSSGSHGGDFSVATYNIRTTNLDSWDSVRAGSILSYIKTEDIVGIQEAKISTTSSKNSLGWLQSKLGSAGYANYAQEQGGEYRAMFWRTDKFTQVDKGNYNIDSERNLVWVKLKFKSTGTILYFATTHLDYSRCNKSGLNTTHDCTIREKQATSIANYISSHMKSVPVVFVGDMNSQYGSDVYKAYTKGGLKNAYDIAKSKVNTKLGSTITDFSGGTSGTLSSGGKPIDHIYVKNGITISRVEVTKHKGSDHVPVEADLSLPGTASSSPVSSTPSSSTAPKLSTNIDNFRDAGTSGYIKTDVLYRSANLNTATASDKLVLSGLLGGGKVIDLRLTKDSGFSSKVDRSLTGVTYLQIGIKGEDTAIGYKTTFINNSDMRKQFGSALTEIAKPGPVLVHCKAGKDRTGWTIALVMMAVGVSKNKAMDEYDNSPDVFDSWFTTAYDEATNKTHTGGSGKIIDFITRKVSQGGLGVSQDTVNALITKLRK